MANLLIPKECATIDNENNKIIINMPHNVGLNVIASALFSFSADNYILFDHSETQKSFVVEIIPKMPIDGAQLSGLRDDVISQTCVFEIHKQKLEKNKQLVNFIMNLIIKTNDK